MILFLALYLTIYIILYLFGYPLKVFLLTDKVKKYDLYVTPWLGLSALSLICIYLSRLGFSISQFSILLLITFVVIDIFIYVRTKERILFDKKELMIFLIIFLGSAVIYLLPLGEVGLGIKSFGNVDVYNYVNIANFVMNHPIKELSETSEYSSHSLFALTLVSGQTRLGVVPLAFFSSIFKIKPYLLTFLWLCSLLSLFVTTFRIFIKGKTLPIIFILMIIAFNQMYQWLLYYGFLGQLFSVGLTLIILYFVNNLIEENKFNLKAAITLALLIVFCGQSYAEGFAYLLVPIGVYGLIVLFDKTRRWNYIKNIILAFCLVLVLDYRVFTNFIKSFLALTDAVAGFPMPSASLPHMVGMINSRFQWLYTSAIPDLNVACIILNIMLFIAIFYYIKTIGFKSFYSITFYVFLVIYIAFAYKFGFDSYKLFKASCSFSFITIILTYGSLLNLLESQKRLLRNLSIGAIAVMLALNLFSTSIYVTVLKSSPVTFTKEEEAISLFVDKEQFNDSNYFINSNHVVGLRAFDFTPPKNSYTMWTNKEFKSGDIYIDSSVLPDIYKINASLLLQNNEYNIYQLGQHTVFPSGQTGLDSPQKWYKNIDEEIFVDTVRQITQSDVSLKFSSQEEQEVTLEMKFIKDDASSLSHIQIYQGNLLIADTTISQNNTCTLKLQDVSFNKGQNELRLAVDNYIGLCISEVSFNGASIPVSLPPENINSSDFILNSIIKNIFESTPMKQVVNFITEIRIKLAESKKIPIDDMKSIVNPTLDISKNKVVISIRNLSQSKLETKGIYPVSIEYRVIDNDDIVILSGRIALDPALKPGELKNYEYANIKDLPLNACYVQFQLVQDRVSYFPAEVLETNISKIKLQQ